MKKFIFFFPRNIPLFLLVGGKKVTYFWEKKQRKKVISVPAVGVLVKKNTFLYISIADNNQKMKGRIFFLKKKKKKKKKKNPPPPPPPPPNKKKKKKRKKKKKKIFFFFFPPPPPPP
ncbi:hypothetical protein NXX12_03290 [Phocaeicola vulgatus]|uniref:hypothetical protein n=1 Tax=Phocaeicola vulgatus TaxID=821 RepID=UPI002165500E|nr:hypothetical protein [Phocaeicola vulgatus]MCS3019328.1 hypothetical protein [Phocaeicola vulgatus]